MIRTPLSRSKSQRSRSPGRFTHRSVIASGRCSVELGNVLSVGTYCYVAVCRRGRVGGARRFGAHGERRRAGAYCGAARPRTACFEVDGARRNENTAKLFCLLQSADRAVKPGGILCSSALTHRHPARRRRRKRRNVLLDFSTVILS